MANSASAAAAMAAADSAFYAAATPKSIAMPAITGVTSGQEISLRMPNAGYGRYLVLTFVGTVTRTEGPTVGDMSPTNGGPWNVFQKISFMDYSGIARLTNVSGAALELRRTIMSARLGGALSRPNGEGIALSNLPFNSAPFYQYQIPAGVASSTATGSIVCSIVVPFSANYRSVLGSFPFTAPAGESVLNFTIQPQVNAAASAVAGDPFNIFQSIYVAGATTTMVLNGSVYPTYYYYDAPAGTPTPVGQISQVFELATVRDTTGLQAGGTKTFILQPGRTYSRVYQNLVMGGTMQQDNLTAVKFLVDSATPTLNEDIYAYVNRTANDYSQPIPDGWIVWDFSRKMWAPDSYGSLTTNLEIAAGAATGTPSYLDTMRECLYVAAASPNLVQSGSVA